MEISYRIVGVFLLIFLIHSCKKDVDNIIKDIDGNVYTSVTIGEQVWMKENLKTTKYRNGDLIETTIPDTLDISTEATPKYQWVYDSNESNVATYGRLYTWWAVTDSRKICPAGWHMPADDEWTILTTYLGGESVASSKLKETGTIHWTNPNTGATNETGFTALPCGNRGKGGTYYDLGYSGIWWSSTEGSTKIAWFRSMFYGDTYVGRWLNDKWMGFSVRCIKD